MFAVDLCVNVVKLCDTEKTFHTYCLCLLSTLAIVTIGFTQGEYSVIENDGPTRVFIERDDVVLDRDILFTIFTVMGPGEAVGMFIRRFSQSICSYYTILVKTFIEIFIEMLDLCYSLIDL